MGPLYAAVIEGMGTYSNEVKTDMHVEHTAMHAQVGGACTKGGHWGRMQHMAMPTSWSSRMRVLHTYFEKKYTIKNTIKKYNTCLGFYNM